MIGTVNGAYVIEKPPDLIDYADPDWSGMAGDSIGRISSGNKNSITGSTTTFEKAHRLAREGITTFPLLFDPIPEEEVWIFVDGAEVKCINIPQIKQPVPRIINYDETGFRLSKIVSSKKLPFKVQVYFL